MSESVRWMAKELFYPTSNGDTSEPTTMSDVWTFEMIAYERVHSLCSDYPLSAYLCTI